MIPGSMSGEMSRIAPVTMALASLNKCSTDAAVSSGRRILPEGDAASASANQKRFVALWPRSSASVRHHPMFTWFTRMPCGRSSAAVFFVKHASAAFEHEYANMNGAPPCAAQEPMLTTAPRARRCFRCRASACVSRNLCVDYHRADGVARAGTPSPRQVSTLNHTAP